MTKIYFLGICVGMQILSDFGFEIEKTKGLGLISGEVKKINTNLKLPHVGGIVFFLKKKIYYSKIFHQKQNFILLTAMNF